MKSCLRPYLLSLLFIWMLPVQSSAAIYINEILAANNTINYDPNFYNFSDWIEIYNDDNSPVNLDGYTITDDINDPGKYLINFTLIVNPGGFAVLWADGEDWYPNTNFSLDSDGEFVALFDPDGVLVDSVSFGAQRPDISYGRYPDGGSEFYYLPKPSCLGTNFPGVADPTRIADTVIFSQGGGFYEGRQTIELSASSPTATIRYTTDGSWPDAESQIYHTPLSFAINRVIKARAFDEGYLPGPVCTETYFIDQETDLPVVSISTHPYNLFSYHYGIYVVGTNGCLGNCADSAVNWNQPWERTINFEYFAQDKQRKVSQVMGITISGRCSRTKIMKPLGLYSRKKYGKVGIDGYQFFNSKSLDSPKTLLLRNSGTESYSTYLRDGFMQTLIMDRMDMDYQAYQPVALYINGDYWGIHNLREKMNEHYVESNYGIDPETIDLLEYNTLYGHEDIYAGDKVLYNEFLDYVTSHDLSIPENYEYVKTQMDVDEFMNIHIANIYFENEDWPNNNNKYWRQRSPGGKWRWYMYDLDFGFGYQSKTGNTVKWVMGESPDSEIASNIKLNEEFKNEFVQRMASHLNTSFRTERVLHILDSLKGNIDQEIYRHVERWGNPWSHDKWESNFAVVENFARERTGIVVPQIMQEFDLTGMFNLEVDNADPALGAVQIAGVDIPNDFQGFYFDDTPLRMLAIPKPGYQFSGWSGDTSSGDDEIYLTSSEDMSVTAHFDLAEAVENLYINEFVASNTRGIVDESEQHEDWIEIYNDNDFPVDLAGFYISDSSEYLIQCQIPYGDSQNTSVPAKGYKLLWADKDPNQGSLHLDLKLRKSGEMILLSQQIGPEIQIIDSVSFASQYSDLSFGRDPQDPDQWIFLEASPEAENLERRLENIFINEFMASNRSVLQDEDGNWDDWIEIYNGNDFPVDVGGMFVSDDPQNKTKFRISDTLSSATTIAANGHLLLWADDSTEQGVLHLNFGLSGSGEHILLVQPGGADIIDSLSYPDLIGDAPYGRSTDGAEIFSYMLATPGASNAQPSFRNLFINEFMASNQTVLEDRNGEYDDWVEIYNGGDSAVNVGGLFLSDDQENRAKFRITTAYPDSTTIPAGGHLLLWADDSTEQGILHMNFGLSGSGEQILLIQADGINIIDSLSYPDLIGDAPYGRSTDGAESFSYMLATPGASNVQPLFQDLYINEILASNRRTLEDHEGEFDDWIELYNGGDSAVNVGGLFLTDDAAKPAKFRISTAYPDSTSIPAGGHLLIWADDSTEQGILHANFQLGKSGDRVILSSTTAELIIDSLSFGIQTGDISLGRTIDGAEDITRQVPSPGTTNRAPSYDGIIISEVMASDHKGLADDFGEYEDWIELYNSSDSAIDIAGMVLSDSLGQVDRFFIPGGNPELTTVAADSFLIIWADGSPGQGVLHADFGLRESGEQVGIFSTAGQLIDSLSYPNQYDNFSYSRFGQDVWMPVPPTPGSRNVTEIVENIYINEYMCDNENRLADEFGEYDDWIEIYNDNTYPVNLAGLYLSDSLANPGMYRIPSNDPESTTLPGKEYMIIWADGDSKQGSLHTNFKLSKGGEDLVLSAYDYRRSIHSLSFGEQYSNFSRGRLNDSSSWCDLPPTPGGSNIMPDLSHLFINEIMTSNKGVVTDNYGEYEDWIEFYNDGPDAIELGGMFITDSLGDPAPFRISSNQPDSTTLQPGEFLLLWADDSTGQGILHVDFKLSRSGEQVALYAYDGITLVDSISYEVVPRNITYGRVEDGYLPWAVLELPTPLQTNSGAMPSGVQKDPVASGYGIYPNPASDKVIIHMDNSAPGHVRVMLYDQAGKLVAMPVNGFYTSGRHEIPWDMQNRNNSALSPGIYFYMFKTEKQAVTGKLIVF